MPVCSPGFPASAFVLQDLYGLAPFDFGVAFALGSVGYMAGSAIAARLVIRLGLDGVLGLGGCACAAGGLAMVAAVAFGFTSSMSLVLPMAVYLAGLGMVLPQGIAGAMTPFPERAGAASSLFGFLQQTAAAVCGARSDGSSDKAPGRSRSASPRWGLQRLGSGLRRAGFAPAPQSTNGGRRGR